MTRQRRVAVTSPQTRMALARRPGAPGRLPHLAPDDADRAWRTYREQRRQAAVAVAVVVLLLFGLPVVLAVLPQLGESRVAGIRVAWLAVGVLPYPVLAALAFWQLRRAERAEDRT
ncbi:MAG TPA: hypothetical protein VM367_04585 [Pseudonocardia sp.]|nr:hypothetical protein [Pseudonocardia sp.]